MGTRPREYGHTPSRCCYRLLQARKSAAKKAKVAREAMRVVAAQADPVLAARLARDAALKTIGKAKNVTFAPGMQKQQQSGGAGKGREAGAKRGRGDGVDRAGAQGSGAAASAKFGGGSGGGAGGTSTAFFSALQEEAQRKIRAIAHPEEGAAAGAKAATKPGASAAARLKL